MGRDRPLRLVDWVVLGLTLFCVFWVLSAWAEAGEGCDGVVVRNFWGWPTCVESRDRP